ncbi:MAG: TIGR04552 family protein [Myxococcota bacterium]
MRRDFLEIDTSFQGSPFHQPIEAQDVEALRVLLTGDSVIDWRRMVFADLAAVDRFLATQLIDPADPHDRERLRYVFNEAISYLEEHLRLRFPAELRNPKDVRDVFVWANQSDGFRRTQILSCVTLKLMHVIHHMEAADLKFRLPVSEAQYLHLAHRRILAQAEQMREMGLPILAFYGSRKSRSAMITKLLAKKKAVAATIFDKLRYRIVVCDHTDIAPALAWLSRNVFPFNYVVPSESHNNLLDPDVLLDHLDSPDERDEIRMRPTNFQTVYTKNEFSGATYRAINWICDYPVRIPDSVDNPFAMELGRVVHVHVEFQLLDQETARRNEEGENAHRLYKARQQRQVAERLKRGFDEPRSE